MDFRIQGFGSLSFLRHWELLNLGGVHVRSSLELFQTETETDPIDWNCMFFEAELGQALPLAMWPL